MWSSIAVIIAILLFVECSCSATLTQNVNYVLQVPSFGGQRYDEYNAVDGTLVGSFDNSILCTPPDIEAYNGLLFVSGYQYKINIYNQTTLEFIGTLWNYTDAPQMLTLLQSNKLAVTVLHEVTGTTSVSFLNLSPTVSEYSTTNCTSADCLDIIQHPFNSSKILVASNFGINSYWWNSSTGSYQFDVQYISYANAGFSSGQGKVTLKLKGGLLFVALNSPSKILKYLPLNNSATYQGVFFNEPALGWNLKGFDFYPNSTTRIIASGNVNTIGKIYDYEAATADLWLYAETNVAEGIYVGSPQASYFDADGNLYVTDASWVLRFDAASGIFKDQIIHNFGFIYPQGVAVNPLGNISIAYVTSGNRIITINRKTFEPIDIFIPQALPGSSDGDLEAQNLIWHNNVLYVGGETRVLAYNPAGELIGVSDTNEQMSDMKLHPNGKIYVAGYFTLNVFEVDLQSMVATKMNVTLPDLDCFIGFSIDGNRMYACLNGDCQGIVVYDITSSNWTLVNTSAIFVSVAMGLEVGPDGTVYLNGYEGIFAINGSTLEGIGFLTGPVQNYRHNAFYQTDIAFAQAIPSTTPTPSLTPSASVTASVSPSPTASRSVSPSTSPSAKTQQSSGKGTSVSAATIGAIVGGIIGALLCTTVVGIIVTRRRREKSNQHDVEEMRLKRLMLAESNGSSSGPSELSQVSSWHQYWEIDFAELGLEEEIGRGAFGSVFKGEWRNSVCVVKQLQSTRNTKEAIDAFLKEANTVKSLRNHRNVCTIFGVTTNPETPICIVMEYCSGGNLQLALGSQKIPLTVNNLIKIFKDITSGMGHVHLEGIVHCDLACRNMLVSFEGSDDFAVKISDFGLARQIPKGQSISVSDDDIFPIRWSAPELLGTKILSAACDVWSFGVVMWEIIEGSIPFGLMNNTQVIQHVCIEHGMLPAPSLISSNQLSSEFYDIMKSCWKYDPIERPSFDELHKMFKEMNRNITEDSKPITVNGQSHYGNVSTERNMRYAKISEFRQNSNDEHYGNNPTIQ